MRKIAKVQMLPTYTFLAYVAIKKILKMQYKNTLNAQPRRQLKKNVLI